ncbi:MAG: NADH-quinone oxidoreductase subunit B family protein [Bellilinea sp.]
MVQQTLNSSWQGVLTKVTNWARINSPWAIHFNSGSCNGCDIQILATLTPRYDVERFGIKLQGSPRHADVLICTGPVTMQARDALLRTYEQMPEPKFVIAVGSCGLSGGVFHGCYNIVGGINELLPVDVFVPGCPPRPEGIIYGVAVLLQALKAGKRPEPIQWSGGGLDGVLHSGSGLEDHHG